MCWTSVHPTGYKVRLLSETFFDTVVPRPTTSRLGNFRTYDPIKLTLITLTLRIFGLTTRNSNFGLVLFVGWGETDTSATSGPIMRAPHDLGSNPGRRDGKPATNRLSCGMTLNLGLKP
jgi:hypothetical protein